MSIIQGARSHYRLFGLKGIFLVANTRLFGKPIEIAVNIDRIAHPVNLRLRTTDVSLFEEIFIHSEYCFEPSRPPRIIVDAGANIGLTSVFFANKFPHAKIIAIEPEEANFKMLQKNANCYSNIFPIQAALWREETVLNLSNPGTGSWGYQTQEQHCDAIEGCVLGMTVDKLMAQYGIDYIDLLKIDIEGSEKEVFETSSSWIDKVGAIIVELHDHIKRGCSRSVYAATTHFEHEWRKGETTFFVKKEHAPSELQETFESTDVVNTGPAITGHNLRSRIVSVVS